MPFSLSPGESTLCLQNVAYALPATYCFIQSSLAMETSLDGSTGWAALTGANTTGVGASGGFIRCPTANATVICKKY